MRHSIPAIFIVLMTAWCFSASAADDPPSIKIGLKYQSASGASYTIENTSSAGTKAANSDSLIGNQLVMEYIVMGRLGLELATSITPLERQYELKSGGSVFSQVTETISMTTYGANLYFNRNTARGLQYFLGVGGGTLAVTHDFNNGTLGNENSSLSMPVTWLKLGMDWLLPSGGVRLEYASHTASTNDTDQVTGYKQTLVYNMAIIGIGVFTFF